jgi:anti-sigma B factor antagonist
MLEFTINTESTATLITMRGELTADAVSNLRTSLKELAKDGGHAITLDLAGLTAIDSAGVGLLAALYNTLAPKGGKLELIRVPGDLYRFFTDMRLHTHFKISPQQAQ